MRDKDSIILENLYSSIYLIESIEDQQRQAQNILISATVNREIWKNKNKPENQEIIQKAKEQIDPIYQQLLKIVEPFQQDQFGKNMSHLPELAKFYLQKPDLKLIEREYKVYMSLGSLKNKNLIKKEPSFIKWAEAIHSEEAVQKFKKEEKTEPDKDRVISGDENVVYENQNVIVFLANNVNDPRESVKNCIKYGKGSSLCISGNTARSYYHQYRWEDRLTTYFIWLKKENRYILVDVTEDQTFQYNNIKDNTDRKATKNEIIKKYPVLKEPFDENIFKSVPIEGKELEFYEKFYGVSSIFNFDTLEDRVMHASLNEITEDDWKSIFFLNKPFDDPSRSSISTEEIKIILQTYIESAEEDIPHWVLKKFPSLEKRYWDKKENKVRREIEEWSDDDELDFYPDEIHVLMNNKNLFKDAMEKIPEIKQDYKKMSSLIKKIKKKTKNGIFTGDINLDFSWFSIDLSFIKEITGGIDTPHAFHGEINLKNLKSCGAMHLNYVKNVNLEKLKYVTSGSLVLGSITELNLKNLVHCKKILRAENAQTINLENLETVGEMYFVDAIELIAPKLRIVMEEKETGLGGIEASKAEKIILPNLKKCSWIVANNVKEINLQNLEFADELEFGHNTEGLLDLRNLKKVKEIKADFEEINLQNLLQADEIRTRGANINLINIKNCGNLYLFGAKNLTAPKLTGVFEIIVPEAERIELPNLLAIEKGANFNNSKILNLKNLKRYGSTQLWDEGGVNEFLVGSLEELNLSNLESAYTTLVAKQIKVLNISKIINEDTIKLLLGTGWSNRFGNISFQSTFHTEKWTKNIKKIYLNSQIKVNNLKEFFPFAEIVFVKNTEEVYESFMTFKKYLSLATIGN